MKKYIKQVKKGLAALMAAVLVLGMVPFTVKAATGNVEILLNGKALTQNDEIGYAVIKDGRTMVPLRLVVESLGFTADWEVDGPKVITMKGRGKEVYHQVGSLKASSLSPMVEGAPVIATTDVPSYVDKATGRTMVGLKLIGDAFGVSVTWERNASGGGKVIMKMEGAAPSDTGNTEVSQAQINAWRPTDPKFLNLALDYEKLADMKVNSKGQLEGVLFNVRGIAMGTYHKTFNIYDDKNAYNSNLRIDLAARIMANKDFHIWANTNKSGTAEIAAKQFQDIQGNETYAYMLTPFVYNGIFDVLFKNDSANFNKTNQLTRNEFVQILYDAGGNPHTVNQAMRDIMLPRYQGVVPDEVLEAWISFGNGGYINRFMSADQVKNIVNGNVTRLEAAVFFADLYAGIGIAGVEVSGPQVKVREDLVNSQAWQSQAAAKFADFTRFVRFEQGGIGSLSANPMYDYERVTSVLCPNNAWKVLYMAELGIITDMGTFRPFEPITRAEFTEMFYRVLEQRANKMTED